MSDANSPGSGNDRGRGDMVREGEQRLGSESWAACVRGMHSPQQTAQCSEQTHSL
jgi:hypothetical protein